MPNAPTDDPWELLQKEIGARVPGVTKPLADGVGKGIARCESIEQAFREIEGDPTAAPLVDAIAAVRERLAALTSVGQGEPATTAVQRGCAASKPGTRPGIV